MPEIHSIIPLALLRAMQEADHLPEVAGEPFSELAATRLGGSDTIAAQVARFEQHLKKGQSVSSTEVHGLLSLVSRRPDADLVFADAGRMAGRMAVQAGGGPGVVSRMLGRRGAYAKARKLSRDIFDCTFENDDRIWWQDTAELGRGALAGSTCRMTGAGVAEVLHILTGFEGALIHGACRRTGGECAWTFESDGSVPRA